MQIYPKDKKIKKKREKGLANVIAISIMPPR
jgi:hypothetical protein